MAEQPPLINPEYHVHLESWATLDKTNVDVRDAWFDKLINITDLEAGKGGYTEAFLIRLYGIGDWARAELDAYSGTAPDDLIAEELASTEGQPIPEEPEEPVIPWEPEVINYPPVNPVASDGYVKIYRDTVGNWCIDDKIVTFKLTGQDWYLFGLGGSNSIYGLYDGSIEYRLSMSGLGKIFRCTRLEVDPVTRKVIPDAPVTEVYEFELPVGHSTLQFFVPGKNAVL